MSPSKRRLLEAALRTVNLEQVDSQLRTLYRRALTTPTAGAQDGELYELELAPTPEERARYEARVMQVAEEMKGLAAPKPPTLMERWARLRDQDTLRHLGEYLEPIEEPDHAAEERARHREARSHGRVSTQRGHWLGAGPRWSVGTEKDWRSEEYGWRSLPVPELPRVNPLGSSGACPVVPEAVGEESTRWGANHPWVLQATAFNTYQRGPKGSFEIEDVLRGGLRGPECSPYLHLGDDVRAEYRPNPSTYDGPRGWCPGLEVAWCEENSLVAAPELPAYAHPANDPKNDNEWRWQARRARCDVLRRQLDALGAAIGRTKSLDECVYLRGLHTRTRANLGKALFNLPEPSIWAEPTLVLGATDD